MDQLWLILKCVGALTPGQATTLNGNPFFAVRLTLLLSSSCSVLAAPDLGMSVHIPFKELMG